MTRESALNRISKPECSDIFLEKEFKYIADKLDLSYTELRDIFNGENKTYKDYNNKKSLA